MSPRARGTVSRMRRSVALALAVSVSALTLSARAELSWPDVPERIERGLASPDAAARRVAARELPSVGATRAEPLLARALADSDVEVRILAAQAAGRLRATSAVDAVLPWLGEREVRLKIAACELAAKLPSTRAVPSLARALGDGEPLVRAACAEALGMVADPAAASALMGRLDDPSPQVRVQVARALARLGDDRAVVPLVGKVQDSVAEVRQAVVRALGELADPRASAALLLALRDASAEVRVEALGAASRARLPEAVALIEPLAFDKNPSVRSAALAALGRIASPDAVRALVRALGAAPEELPLPLTRTPVRSALVAAGSAAIPELARVVSGPGPSHVTAAAAWVLGELGARSAAQPIVKALRAGSVPAAAALHALAGAGSAQEIPVVLEFVADPNPVVRSEARATARALLDPKHPDGRAVEPLAAALRDPRLAATERAELCTLLGRTGAPRAARELTPFLATKDRALRLAAIDALGLLREGDSQGETTNAFAQLLPAMGDPDPTIRLHAANAFAAGGDVSARRALEGALAKGDADRFAVLTAIGGILERHADADAALARLADLPLASGAERDAVLEAAGRARHPRVVDALARVAADGNVGDRRMIAQVLGLHGGEPRARTLLEKLAHDADPEVRAQAAYALGSAFPDAKTLAELARVADGPDRDAAVDAAAAVARVAGAFGNAAVTSFACPRLRHPRPAVAANALAALTAVASRCGGGEVERALLDAPDERVRLAAARLVASNRRDADRVALARCERAEPSPEVAEACTRAGSLPVADHADRTSMTAFVHTRGDAPPSAGVPYLVELPGGVLRAGLTDRRGAFFEPLSPPGDVVVRRDAP